MSSSTPAITVNDSLRPRHSVPAGTFTFQSSERHLRAVIGSVTLLDSYAPVLIWEPDRSVPGYVVPRADIRSELLRPAIRDPRSNRVGVNRWYDAVIDGRTYPALVYEYDVHGLEDYLGVDWFGRSAPGVEHWYEEDEEIFRHPRDPYHRVDALPSSRHVQIFLDGAKLADTHDPVLLFETSFPARYYVPPQDVDFTHLDETDLVTTCPYKGNARYWSVEIDGNVHPDIVWSYPTPIAAAGVIQGRLAFYNERVEIVVNDVALPRHGAA